MGNAEGAHGATSSICCRSGHNLAFQALNPSLSVCAYMHPSILHPSTRPSIHLFILHSSIPHLSIHPHPSIRPHAFIHLFILHLSINPLSILPFPIHPSSLDSPWVPSTLPGPGDPETTDQAHCSPSLSPKVLPFWRKLRGEQTVGAGTPVCLGLRPSSS